MGDLARFLKISIPYLSDVERGNRPPLLNERIVAAAEYLDIDPVPLLRMAGEERGSFDLDAEKVSPKAREVGAALMRTWSNLSDEELEQIADVVERRSR